MKDTGILENQKNELIGAFQAAYPELYSNLQNITLFETSNSPILVTVCNEGTGIMDGE